MTGGAFAVPVTASLAVDDNAVSPGVLGFVVVALLGVATYLLIRSMNRQIKQIDLPDDDAPADQRNGDDPGDVPPVDGDQPQR